MPLAELQLSAEQSALVQRRAGGKAEPTLLDLDRWLRAKDLSETERDLFTDIRAAMVGGQRSANLVRLSGEGERPVRPGDAGNYYFAQDVVGDLPQVVKLRDDLRRDGLPGQQQALPGFLALAKDFYSPARETSPVLAISGDPGHGKNEAVQAFSFSLFGNEVPPPLKVDLSKVVDRDAIILFEGEDAPLSLEKLREMQETGGVVHLTGVDNLVARAPDVAAKLAARLSAREGDSEYARVPYVLDYSTPGDATAMTAMALGSVGIESLAGSSQFGHLDEDAVWHYAEQRIAEKMKKPGLDGLVLELEPQAKALLKQMLTTPHAPLDSLEERLVRFLFTHVDTQTNVDRADSVIGISVSEPYREVNRAWLTGVIDALHQPEPNLNLGTPAFRANLTAKTHHLDADGLAAAGQSLKALMDDVRGCLPSLFREPGTDEDADRMDVLQAQTEAAFQAFHMAEKELADAALFNRLVPLKPGVHRVLKSALEAVRATIEEAVAAVEGAEDDEGQAIARAGAGGLSRLDELLPLVDSLAKPPVVAEAAGDAPADGQ
ncbi:MAG: hypothetical protein IPJ65_25025 [Archangiaceae bacterium]|nr:hypothetical protein [Archangiaceae bacterium]